MYLCGRRRLCWRRAAGGADAAVTEVGVEAATGVVDCGRRGRGTS